MSLSGGQRPGSYRKLYLVGIPPTFSIADGIAFGLISYSMAKVATGRWRECPVLTYIFAALFIVQFLIL